MMKNLTILAKRFPAFFCLCALMLTAATSHAQTLAKDERARRVSDTASAAAPRYESARSDKFTGGALPRTEFTPGDADIRITVDVPAFRLSLWQNGKIVSAYPIGIGLFDFQVPIGERRITELVYNPAWIPPGSEWVINSSRKVKPGEIITAEDPRNPLGKMKIPLGSGYLIHEAAGVGDLGNLVSHGCIRMLRRDIYDLAEKIILARSLPITAKEIAAAKASKKTRTVKLDQPLSIDLDYDTQVVEEGMLHIYPDVYERGTNTVARLRQELESSDIDPDAVDGKSYELLLTRPTKTAAFVTPVESVKQNLALTAGRLKPLVTARTTNAVKTRRATRSRARR